MSSEDYHELEELTSHTRIMHQAIVSLMEELEAVYWYQKRIDTYPQRRTESNISLSSG